MCCQIVLELKLRSGLFTPLLSLSKLTHLKIRPIPYHEWNIISMLEKTVHIIVTLQGKMYRLLLHISEYETYILLGLIIPNQFVPTGKIQILAHIGVRCGLWGAGRVVGPFTLVRIVLGYRLQLLVPLLYKNNANFIVMNLNNLK